MGRKRKSSQVRRRVSRYTLLGGRVFTKGKVKEEGWIDIGRGDEKDDKEKT